MKALIKAPTCQGISIFSREQIIAPSVLAVSTHCFCSSQCHVGSRVTLKAGGDFFFDPGPQEQARPLLLVAGGVGINPLVSVLRHCRHLRAESRRTRAGYAPGRLELLYSARSAQELIFRVGGERSALPFRMSYIVQMAKIEFVVFI